jgi:hypothetical protein
MLVEFTEPEEACSGSFRWVFQLPCRFAHSFFIATQLSEPR